MRTQKFLVFSLGYPQYLPDRVNLNCLKRDNTPFNLMFGEAESGREILKGLGIMFPLLAKAPVFRTPVEMN